MKGRRSDRGLEQILDVLTAEILATGDAEITDMFDDDQGPLDRAEAEVGAIVARARAEARARHFRNQGDDDERDDAPRRN